MPLSKKNMRILIEKNPEVKQIAASYLGLGNNDIEALVLLLKENPYITKLDLSGNNITMEGAKRLSTLTLEDLNLSDNKIGNQGALCFLYSNIKKIDLTGNGLTHQTFKMLNETAGNKTEFINTQSELMDRTLRFFKQEDDAQDQKSWLCCLNC